MTAVSETTKAPGSAAADVRDITVAHSPDSDDAFMFYGLATHKVRAPGLRFTHTLCDIETLNQKAREGLYDVTAISFHAYPYVQDKYALMACGGSVGEGYGPMIVSPRPFTASEVKTKRIAVPGTLTTAYLALHLFAPGVETEVVPFDQIIPQVLEGKYEAGLIIHEGQITYDKAGLHRVVDLGYRLAASAGRQRHPARARSRADAGGDGCPAREHSVCARASGRGPGVCHAVCP
jgi:1,4-dihydroxy-6-naphthoate synthase